MRFSLAAMCFVLAASPMASTLRALPGDNTRPPGAHAKGVNLSGQVSNDGKTLLADDDNTWSVNNADLLKGLEGRYVTVKCQMDPGKRAIRVLHVVEPEMKRVANSRDSAFRR